MIEKHFGYNSVDAVAKIVEDSPGTNKELSILRHCNHYHQTDALCIAPVEAFIKSSSKPQTNVGELYLLNTQAVMVFLHQQGLGYSNYHYNKLKARVEKLADLYLDYKVKFEEPP